MEIELICIRMYLKQIIYQTVTFVKKKKGTISDFPDTNRTLSILVTNHVVSMDKYNNLQPTKYSYRYHYYEYKCM